MNSAISPIAWPRAISIPSWPRPRNSRSSKRKKLFRWVRFRRRTSSLPRFSCTASCMPKECASPDDAGEKIAMTEKARLTREQLAQRPAQELYEAAYVNLLWGIPLLIADYLPKGLTIYFHSENGILGMGRRAKPGEEDFDLVDAMKVPVTLIPGASIFHQADAHLMTRGGHLDIAVLGGFQASEKVDLANWKIPGSKGSGGIGGAMDLASAPHNLIASIDPHTQERPPKNSKTRHYPLTGLECVDTIVTDLAVIDVTPEGLFLREVAPTWTSEEVQVRTEAKLIVRNAVPQMKLA